MNPIVILPALFGPFLLWPIEYLLPYPYVVEELFKTVVVLVSINQKTSPAKFFGTFALAGIGFALTETVFYAIDVGTLGAPALFITRLGVTGILHSVTFLVIAFFGRIGKKFLPVGFLLAMAIHYFYNLNVPGIK
jgi:RsiW-degrading membrane proteinase PrsW (M82 family)